MPTTSSATTKFLKVYLNRGFIGLPDVVRKHALALGLRKRYQTVYLRPGPEVIGNLLRIKELVKVDLVENLPAPKAPKSDRSGLSVRRSLLASGKEPDTSIRLA